MMNFLNKTFVLTPEGDMTYDGKGNITAHDAAGAFSYASSKPYALSQIALAVTDFPTATQTITYNSMNRPDTISEGSVTARFKYFEDGERSQMIVSGSNCYNVHKYFGTQFTTLDLNEQGYEGQKQILFLGGDAYTAQAALVREKDSGSSTWSQSLYYIVRDNLGSITQVVDSTGMVAQELSYDAWGRLRAPETLQPYAPNSQPNLLLGRGFCGHEHLPKFNLINMNARLYDPWASRFLSPDPYVQIPDFTQSLNRYSYCLNNPLKYVDQNGEVWLYSESCGRTYYLFDEDINDNNDLRNKYGREANLNILDDSGYYLILLRNKNNDILGNVGLTGNGCIYLNGQQVVDVNIGNVYFSNLKTYTFGNNVEAWNLFFRTFYVGPNNPQFNKSDTYVLPPINELDEAAYQHDMDYDHLHVRGLCGVMSLKTLKADWNLTKRSFVAVHNYKNIYSPEHSAALCTTIAFSSITLTKISICLSPLFPSYYFITNSINDILWHKNIK